MLDPALSQYVGMHHWVLANVKIKIATLYNASSLYFIKRSIFNCIQLDPTNT
jgi:hypothetical protein